MAIVERVERDRGRRRLENILHKPPEEGAYPPPENDSQAVVFHRLAPPPHQRRREAPQPDPALRIRNYSVFHGTHPQQPTEPRP